MDFSGYGSKIAELLRLIGDNPHSKTVTGNSDDRHAAVAIILRETSMEQQAIEPGALPVEVLYIRRTVNGADPWSGHMAFPGGHVDHGDVDAVAAAVREVQEEVGLDLGRYGQLVGFLDDIRASARGSFLPLVITPVVFCLRNRDVVLEPQPREVEASYWIPVSFLLDPDNLSTNTFYHKDGVAMDFPCWRVDGNHRIWGLTYMMTVNLLRVWHMDTHGLEFLPKLDEYHPLKP